MFHVKRKHHLDYERSAVSLVLPAPTQVRAQSLDAEVRSFARWPPALGIAAGG